MTEIELTVDPTLFGGLSEVFERFCVVALNPLAVHVHYPQAALSHRIILNNIQFVLMLTKIQGNFEKPCPRRV